MQLLFGELYYRGITAIVNSFLSIIHWFLTIKCGTVDEGTTKEERKQKDKKIHNNQTREMLRDLKRVIQKKWKNAKRRQDKETQKKACTQF
jgi:hypothetical protein